MPDITTPPPSPSPLYVAVVVIWHLFMLLYIITVGVFNNITSPLATFYAVPLVHMQYVVDTGMSAP